MSPKELVETALRVLAAWTDGRKPAPADVEALKRAFPSSVWPTTSPLMSFGIRCLTCKSPRNVRRYPAQSRRRVVSPCARAVVRSRSRMAVNMNRTCGIARFSLSATGW